MPNTQDVTMTLKVPHELSSAFMEAVNEEKRPASHVILGLMQEYVSRIQEKNDPERDARADDVQEALASVRLEGYKPSKYAQELGQQYIDGKITAHEQISLIRKHYGLDQGKGAVR